MYPTQADAITKDEFLLAMDASTGLYLLALINVDLRRSGAQAPREWLERMHSFACYLADNLREDERMPVPSLRSLVLQES